MLVLDWRPFFERWLAGRSVVAEGLEPHSIAGALAGKVADAICGRRAARRLPPPRDVLVVSVGNLRVGGTGKTPVVLAAAQALESRGFRGAVLLRGYGGRSSGPLLVESGDHRASDEARWLAAGLAEGRWSVMQARRRHRGLTQLLASRPRPEVILLEDGFQTAAVGRHLDVLILDAWDARGDRLTARTGAVLPFGPYRETVRGAGRAHVWLLETDDLSGIPPPRSIGNAPRVHGFRRDHVLQPGIVGARPAAATGTTAQRWGLVAGLARPEVFEAAAASLLQDAAVLAVRCGDHCAYGAELTARILAAGRQHGVTAWITTQKDWIKLRRHWPADQPVYVVRQTVVWIGAETLPDLIEERLASLVRGSRQAL